MDNASDMNQPPVEPVVQQQAERLFKQSELNEIVGRAKHEAVESFKRQQQQVQQPQQAANSQRYLSEEDIKRVAAEELSRQKSEWEKESLERAYAEAAQRIVDTYKQKIATGKDKYQDFDTVTNSVDMRYYPNVVQLLAEYVDNASDVLYDLAKNRSKLYQLESACQHNPQDAIYEIKRLSESIKSNETASQIKHANTPLSQQRPSNTGMDSGLPLSVRDYKRKYRC